MLCTWRWRHRRTRRRWRHSTRDSGPRRARSAWSRTPDAVRRRRRRRLWRLRRQRGVSSGAPRPPRGGARARRPRLADLAARGRPDEPGPGDARAYEAGPAGGDEARVVQRGDGPAPALHPERGAQDRPHRARRRAARARGEAGGGGRRPDRARLGGRGPAAPADPRRARHRCQRVRAPRARRADARRLRAGSGAGRGGAGRRRRAAARHRGAVAPGAERARAVPDLPGPRPPRRRAPRRAADAHDGRPLPRGAAARGGRRLGEGRLLRRRPQRLARARRGDRRLDRRRRARARLRRHHPRALRRSHRRGRPARALSARVRDSLPRERRRRRSVNPGESMDAVGLASTLERVHDADVAEALNAIDPPAAARVLAALPFELAVRALNQPELDHRARLFEHLPIDRAVALMGAVSADQRADVFRGLPQRVAARLLAAVDRGTQESLRSVLNYPPTTAGGIMTTEHVEAPATWTVERALVQIRSGGHPRRPVYAVYVLDPVDRRLVHTVTLRELVLADPTRTLLEVGDRHPPVTVRAWTDREETARLIAKYDLLAVPVIDEGGHLLGIVTVDDVIDALIKEQTEDVHKLGGMQELDEPYTKVGFWTMIRKRGGWLCALFLSEMLTATAMQHFEGALSRAIVLTLFIPLIMSSGGNSGSQATSLIIRALALREVRLRDWWWIALRELPAGVTLGAILGAIGLSRIVSWQLFGFYDYGPHWSPVALAGVFP